MPLELKNQCLTCRRPCCPALVLALSQGGGPWIAAAASSAVKGGVPFEPNTRQEHNTIGDGDRSRPDARVSDRRSVAVAAELLENKKEGEEGEEGGEGVREGGRES